MRACWRMMTAGALALLIGTAALASASAQASPSDSRVSRIVAAAIAQTTQRVTYDGSYRRIPYPGGDVPADVGVCTDVVIRAWREVGIDLQRLVHEDMRKAFDRYPKIWGLRAPDPNIDHRRVPNLQVFLTRQGAQLTVSDDAGRFQAGDLVTWRLPGNLPHIGIVSDRYSPDGKRPLIIHNIGQGPQIEDMLFRFEITGHYRFMPPSARAG